MEKYYTLTQIAELMAKGEIEDKTGYVNSLGEKVTVSDGAVRWVTENDYVSNIVGITRETVSDVWREIKDDLGVLIDFIEAIEALEDEQTVLFTTPNGSMYQLNTLDGLDNIIRDFGVQVVDLYNGKAELVAPLLEEEAVDPEPEELTIDVDELNFDGLLKAFGMVGEEDVDTRGRKLHSKEVYAIHFRKHLLGDVVANIAENFDVTPRMVYYILDGTYWPDIYADFHADYDVYSI